MKFFAILTANQGGTVAGTFDVRSRSEAYDRLVQALRGTNVWGAAAGTPNVVFFYCEPDEVW